MMLFTGHLPATESDAAAEGLDLLLTVHDDGTHQIAARPGYQQTHVRWSPPTELHAEAGSFDEPQGLGAVVEVLGGDFYIRDKTTTTACHWKRAAGEDRGRRYPWTALAVVSVRSRGWSPT